MVKQANWVKAKPEEVEKKVIELAKQNMPPEKIGLVLRDQHGIPKAKIYGLKIGKILKSQGIEVDSEKRNIERKMDSLKKHSAKNKHDYTAKRSIVKQISKLNKIKKQKK